MRTERVIDYSRYRVVEAMAEMYRLGATPQVIGEEYAIGPYEVELILAAFDRKDEWAGVAHR